jgi:glyoxylase-like metal-dependent hydrolase (beta-lactamase superfamily II)
MSPEVQSFFHEDSGTWTHLAWDPQTRAAAIVDPVLDFDPASGRTSTRSAEQVMRALRERGLELHWILETHAHADHLTAAQWLRSVNPGSRVAIGAGIRDVQRSFGELFNLGPEFRRDGTQFDHLFADEEPFLLGRIAARALATPGHTGDSLSYLIGDALFCGDSLFMPEAGTARCDFPGGDARRLYRSIRRLYALPGATRVFVCHDYPAAGHVARCETTVEAQRHGNVHVREDVAEDDYVRVREARDATLAAPRLILPALQVNIRAGHLPPAEDNGVSYLKLPIDRFGSAAEDTP